MKLLSSIEENKGADTREFGKGYETSVLEAEINARSRRSQGPEVATWQATADSVSVTCEGQRPRADQDMDECLEAHAQRRAFESGRPRWTLHPLQEWEGYVIEFNDEEFVARLVDITAGDEYETEEATIPLEEISDADAKSLELGKIFRWVIGYERSVSGGKKRVSQIVFRDLPRRTQRDWEKAEAWAEKMEAFLNG
ncbi:MAG: hypothetical protein OXM02_07225 [Bacteroidota bacterium]|nr:hypothetical protein [Bacteroidota bacterium]MDE2957887.1 hypothetical protein [Bacteroidota bacterium]